MSQQSIEKCTKKQIETKTIKLEKEKKIFESYQNELIYIFQKKRDKI